MKAARKAHGESTDVGTEEDLWGPSKEQQRDVAEPRVNMSMPTHLEIGLLPPSNVPHQPGEYRYIIMYTFCIPLYSLTSHTTVLACIITYCTDRCMYMYMYSHVLVVQDV